MGARRSHSHVSELTVKGHLSGRALLLDRRRAGQRGPVLMREHAHRDEISAAHFGEQAGRAVRITAALAAESGSAMGQVLAGGPPPSMGPGVHFVAAESRRR